MTEAEFRTRLEQLGLRLDDRSFAAAFAGARHLRAEVEKVKACLRDTDDTSR